MPRKKADIRNLYYITHVDNVPSILKHGILAHNLLEERGIKYVPIYDEEIVEGRRRKTTPDGRTLGDFANLYFQPRNPMLYRVLHEKKDTDIVVLAVQARVLEQPETLVSDGNAASASTLISLVGTGLRAIDQNWDTLTSEWWSSVNGTKRKIMAECLVPGDVPPDLIHTVYVSSHAAAERLRQTLLPLKLAIVPEPKMFFRPTNRYRLTDHLFLAEGDMFFSTMQTLTVSVNLKGVMGKGLASRAKYQFPDVYVVYQEACKKKLIGMGRPFLYKRESPVDEELADESRSLPSPNAVKWFLLFPTKRHWRDVSDMDSIRIGLQWVRRNYKKEGIRSVALPALGCGLGRLDWQEVGPLMCRELSPLEIDVAVYLPREKQIPEEQLLPAFLLKH